MSRQLTKQEELFIERLAIEIVRSGGDLGDASINAAAEAVTAADRRLVSLLVGKLRDKAVTHFSDRAWRAMQ